MSSIIGEGAADLFIQYHSIISSESDRGSVVLVGSILDQALKKLIVSFLIPSIKKDDKLINGAYAPLGSFSAKIEISYRLGLIKPEVLEQLQLFKSIRNDFAHRITDTALDSENNKNKMQVILNKYPQLSDAFKNCISNTLQKNEIIHDSKSLISILGVRAAFDILFATLCMSLERSSLDIKRIDAYQI